MHFFTVPVEAALDHTCVPSLESTRPLALVVDDDPLITGTLAAVLDHSGSAVLTSCDVQQAIATARLIPPEILISDVTLPDGNGFDLASEITGAVSDCAVILFCGPQQDFDRAARRPSRNSALRILAKPVHPVDLLKGVFDLLTREGGPLELTMGSDG